MRKARVPKRQIRVTIKPAVADSAHVERIIRKMYCLMGNTAAAIAIGRADCWSREDIEARAQMAMQWWELAGGKAVERHGRLP